MSADLDRAIAAKGRHISLVIAGTMLAWLALTMIIGPAINLPGRYALLFDFAALAGLIYAAVNIMQLWRLRQASKNENQG
jgi:membrane protein implicated in regulation of membrane protease activity